MNFLERRQDFTATIKSVHGNKEQTEFAFVHLSTIQLQKKTNLLLLKLDRRRFGKWKIDMTRRTHIAVVCSQMGQAGEDIFRMIKNYKLALSTIRHGICHICMFDSRHLLHRLRRPKPHAFVCARWPHYICEIFYLLSDKFDARQLERIYVWYPLLFCNECKHIQKCCVAHLATPRHATGYITYVVIHVFSTVYDKETVVDLFSRDERWLWRRDD